MAQEILQLPPLSLYIHMPWCIRKCPYCDFNSHQINNKQPPEAAYIEQLIKQLQQQIDLLQDRPIKTIFIGGGTPSLISAKGYEKLFSALQRQLQFADDIEITLEANPGAIDQQKFYDYRQIGINRLSLGIQSFDDKQLKKLGRIHDSRSACIAIETARKAGFERLNLDLMFGLPEQSVSAGLKDLTQALQFKSEHLSWYQLTIEPHTHFYKRPPPLPIDDEIARLQTEGQTLLAQHQLQQYEISAYARHNAQCQHNLNYWRFGDYLGLGAGAHSKITQLPRGQIIRLWCKSSPKSYLSADFMADSVTIKQSELPLEFMLNNLRLIEKIPLKRFANRTGLRYTAIDEKIARAERLGLIIKDDHYLTVTLHGRLFLNDLLEVFL